MALARAARWPENRHCRYANPGLEFSCAARCPAGWPPSAAAFALNAGARSDARLGFCLCKPRSIGWQAELDVRLNEAAQYSLGIGGDHTLFRGVLREAVSGLFTRADIAEAGTLEEVSAILDRAADVDLILLDLTMPGVRGLSGLMYLRAQYPSVPVVIVSANDEPAVIRRCMDFGASGFIPKTLGVEAMRDAIAGVLKGGVWTPPDVDLNAAADAETTALLARPTPPTPHQGRVLMMLSEGLLNKQIAYELGVSEATVKAHVSAILQKLGVESRTQAVIVASKIEGGQWNQVPPLTH